MNTRRRIVPIAVLALLIATPALTACTIENVIERATGGSVDIGGTSVPDDFPAEVPLYDGEVVSAVGIGNPDGKVWNVGVRIPDIAALGDIQADLEAAGFTVSIETPATDQGGTLIASTDEYGVAIVAVRDGEGFVANYSVTSTGGGQ